MALDYSYNADVDPRTGKPKAPKQPSLTNQWNGIATNTLTRGATTPGVETPGYVPGGTTRDATTNSVDFGGATWGDGEQRDVVEYGGSHGTVAPRYGGATTNSMTREDYRDKWMGSGVRDMAGLEAFVRENGGEIVSGNGTVRTPSGEYIDMLIGARTNGSGMPGWTGTGGGGGNRSNGGNYGGAMTNSGGGRSADMDAFMALLMDRAKQSTVVGRYDPAVRQAADAFAAQQTQQGRQFLDESAEANGPYGTGAQDNLRRLTAERAGQASGAMEAELINRERMAKRDEIMQALQLQGNMLSQQEQLALQKYLGELNAQIARDRMNQDQSQFDAQLGFNVDDRNSYWDWIRSGGGGV